MPQRGCDPGRWGKQGGWIVVGHNAGLGQVIIE
jgi:hypothetical protein